MSRRKPKGSGDVGLRKQDFLGCRSLELYNPIKFNHPFNHPVLSWEVRGRCNYRHSDLATAPSCRRAGPCQVQGSSHTWRLAWNLGACRVEAILPHFAVFPPCDKLIVSGHHINIHLTPSSPRAASLQAPNAPPYLSALMQLCRFARSVPGPTRPVAVSRYLSVTCLFLLIDF